MEDHYCKFSTLGCNENKDIELPNENRQLTML